MIITRKLVSTCIGSDNNLLLATLLEIEDNPTIEIPIGDDDGFAVPTCLDVLNTIAGVCMPVEHRVMSDHLKAEAQWKAACAFLGIEHGYPYDDMSGVRFLPTVAATMPPDYGDLLKADDRKRKGDYRTPGRVSPWNDLVNLTEPGFRYPDADRLRIDPLMSSRLAPHGVMPLPPPPPPPDVTRLRDTVEWLRSGGLGDLPYFEEGRAGVVLAGGFPFGCLLGTVILPRPRGLQRLPILPGKSDIDVFIVVPYAARIQRLRRDGRRDPVCKRSLAEAANEIANEVLQDTIKALATEFDIQWCTRQIWPRGKTIDLIIFDRAPVAEGEQRRWVKVQIVMAVFDTASHVVTGFDVDACKILFDVRGGRALACKEAVLSFATGCTMFDANKASMSMVHRYGMKYVNERGFHVLIPGVPQATLDEIVRCSSGPRQAALDRANAQLRYVSTLLRHPGGSNGPTMQAELTAAVRMLDLVLLKARIDQTPWINGLCVRALVDRVCDGRVRSTLPTTDYGDPDIQDRMLEYPTSLFDPEWNLQPGVEIPWVVDMCGGAAGNFTGSFNPVSGCNIYLHMNDTTTAERMLQTALELERAAADLLSQVESELFVVQCRSILVELELAE